MNDNRKSSFRSLPDKFNHIPVAVIVVWTVMTVGHAAGQDGVQAQLPRQTDQRNGEIELWVVDPLGAVIAKAGVKLSGVDGTILSSRTTAYDGSLRLPGLTPGSYVLEISQQGFQTYRENVSVKAGSSTRLNVTLKVAAAGWSTGPGADPPLVDTGEPPAAPTEIDSKPVQPIPQLPKRMNHFKRFFVGLFHKLGF